jgi:hypothetical protein
MPCIAALLVLGIMGIFSASHRKLAREALDCVLRRVTLRPCDTGFDVKVKATVLGKLMKKSPKLAKFVGKYFDWLSLLLVGITIVASLYSLRGIYNYYAWGNCGGQQSSSFCVFDPKGKNTKSSTILSECSVEPTEVTDLDQGQIEMSHYVIENPESEKEIVMLGCFSCEYTRKIYPQIRDIVDATKPSFSFIHFPVHQETEYVAPYDYCIRKTQASNYQDFLELMFNNSVEVISQEENLQQLLTNAGFEMEKITECLQDSEALQTTEKELQQVQKTGIFGTPTIFVNGTPVVGPKPERVYKRLLRNTWF